MVQEHSFEHPQVSLGTKEQHLPDGLQIYFNFSRGAAVEVRDIRYSKSCWDWSWYTTWKGSMAIATPMYVVVYHSPENEIATFWELRHLLSLRCIPNTGRCFLEWGLTFRLWRENPSEENEGIDPPKKNGNHFKRNILSWKQPLELSDCCRYSASNLGLQENTAIWSLDSPALELPISKRWISLHYMS